MNRWTVSERMGAILLPLLRKTGYENNQVIMDNASTHTGAITRAFMEQTV